MTTLLAIWLSPSDVASRVGCHVVTVWRALESGELHGHQPRRGGRWRVDPASADAWITGANTGYACRCARARKALEPPRRGRRPRQEPPPADHLEGTH